jgi:hypothetical protein
MSREKVFKYAWNSAIVLAGIAIVILCFMKNFSLVSFLGDNSILLFIVLALVAFFAEYVDSSLGMGYGTTLTPVLIIVGFSPLQIVPAILFSEFISGISAGIMHHKADNVDFIGDKTAKKTMWIMTLCSCIGVLAAVIFALKLPKQYVKIYIAVMIMAMGVFLLIGRKFQQKFSLKKIIAIGTIAAFNKGISGGGYGPLLTGGQVLSGVKEKNAVAITSMAEGLVCLLGFCLYLFSRGGIYWKLALPMTVGAFISVPLAVVTVKILPENHIKNNIAYVTLFLGVLALVKVFI